MRLFSGLVLALLAASPAAAEDWDFMLINSTGKAVKLVELAPTGTTDWKASLSDEGIVKKEVIKPGERTTVRLDRPSDQCRYDLRMTYADAATQVFGPVNICNNSYITIKLIGDKPAISAN